MSKIIRFPKPYDQNKSCLIWLVSIIGVFVLGITIGMIVLYRGGFFAKMGEAIEATTALYEPIQALVETLNEHYPAQDINIEASLGPTTEAGKSIAVRILGPSFINLVKADKDAKKNQAEEIAKFVMQHYEFASELGDITVTFSIRSPGNFLTYQHSYTFSAENLVEMHQN